MLKIFNSLSRQVEEFHPDHEGSVKMYTCGPTVYSYPTIGNWRTYVLSDLVFRALSFEGFRVDYVMNLTDVGHLTGDNLGDSSTGEDRLEKQAAKERKSAWDIAKFYGDDFLESYKKLNLLPPKQFCKATEHIEEQINLVKKIEEKGFAYRITDGIYFDVAAYEKSGNAYGELSNLEEIKAGARVEVNPEKRDQRDFALWKFSPEGVKRDMEWESPWGVGFPGWHIECSAMSMKYLGEQLDIHIGGEDLKSTHHPNEIAQSEAATGKKPFTKYWMHGAFLLVDGGRMGKSLGNAYTMQDIEDKGFSPLALRYYYMTTQYRKQMNFTWEGLEASSNAYEKLKRDFLSFEQKEVELSDRGMDYRSSFQNEIENDLNLPGALAVVWQVVKDEELESAEKWQLVQKFDRILGLKLAVVPKVIEEIPAEVTKLMEYRAEVRKNKDWAKSDELRDQIEAFGYKISDFAGETKIEKIKKVVE